MTTNPNDLDIRHDHSFTYDREELISLLQEYATEYGFTIGLFGSYAKVRRMKEAILTYPYTKMRISLGKRITK